jgi:PAS domain S-box-containing protein
MSRAAEATMADLDFGAAVPRAVQNMGSLPPKSSWKRLLFGVRTEQVVRSAAAPPVALLERVPDALFSLDQAWRFTYLNAGAEGLFCRGRDELVGQRLWDRFPELVGSIFDQQYRRAVGERVPVTFEACHPPASTWVQVRAYPAAGGLEVHARDITPGKRAAESLRRWVQVDEVRFRALVEHAADIVALLNADGTIRYVSEALEHVLGYAPEEWIGRSAFEFAHPDDRPQMRRIFDEEVTRQGFSALAECRLRHAEGRWVPVETVGNNLLDEPSIGGIVVTARDITERHRAAAALAEARRRLAESREAERLRLARELHDGPVQDLLAVSYQLADRGRAAGANPAAAGSHATTAEPRQRVLSVVDQLREVIGDLRPPGLTEFGLPAALEGWVSSLQREGGGQPPAIVLELDDEAAKLPQPLALTLFRIVQEALRNVIRHAEARQVVVGIRMEDGAAVLAVRDDGRGFMVPIRLNHLARDGHFGLVGLAERVEQAGGELTVVSSPGMGTTITARLPLAQPPLTHEPSDSRAAR